MSAARYRSEVRSSQRSLLAARVFARYQRSQPQIGSRRARSSPSAIWDRALLWVHRNNTRFITAFHFSDWIVDYFHRTPLYFVCRLAIQRRKVLHQQPVGEDVAVADFAQEYALGDTIE
jgi:hypothetical protein